MSTTCRYCNNTFASVGNLNRHIETAQYCLDIRAGRRAAVVVPRVVPVRPVVNVVRPKPSKPSEPSKVVKNLKVVRIGGKTVDMRPNKYVNAKQLGEALSMKHTEWKDLDKVSRQIKDVLQDVDLIVKDAEGVRHEWWHPDLAIAFAQSVSVKAWLQLSAAQRS